MGDVVGERERQRERERERGREKGLALESGSQDDTKGKGQAGSRIGQR